MTDDELSSAEARRLEAVFDDTAMSDDEDGLSISTLRLRIVASVLSEEEASIIASALLLLQDSAFELASTAQSVEQQRFHYAGSLRAVYLWRVLKGMPVDGSPSDWGFSV